MCSSEPELCQPGLILLGWEEAGCLLSIGELIGRNKLRYYFGGFMLGTFLVVVAKKEVTSGFGGEEGAEEEKDGEEEERREEEARLFLAEVRCLRDLGSILLRILNYILT